MLDIQKIADDLTELCRKHRIFIHANCISHGFVIKSIVDLHDEYEVESVNSDRLKQYVSLTANVKKDGNE